MQCNSYVDHLEIKAAVGRFISCDLGSEVSSSEEIEKGDLPFFVLFLNAVERGKF